MTSQARITQLVEELAMKPHPEGGFYVETYRSPETIMTANGERSLMTVIYFLLRSEDVSHFHRIQSDEHWFWHEGSPLTVHVLNHSGYEMLQLGPIGRRNCKPQQLVPAKMIFGSTVDETNSYALVSCVVAPGFDFKDFELLKRKDLLTQFPGNEKIILLLSR
ncbi:cupin domain-containing protein [Algoriphagus sp.]|uniref:cupin domain-containing protein n=1 Tax=Algoriphagus sp. TaxID=1872435 RepID=UPI0026248A7F|nr:cupin domain-containing protein [Algoriphagus sp.]